METYETISLVGTDKPIATDGIVPLREGLMCVLPSTPACQARPSLRGIFFWLVADPQCGLVNGLVRAHTEQGALLKDQQQRYSVDMATVAGIGESESPSTYPDEHIRQAHLGQLRQGTSDCLENELIGATRWLTRRSYA